ncbi:MAG: sigma-54 dependent transcriptional regulator [Thermodesulfobacteriota bacterium]
MSHQLLVVDDEEKIALNIAEMLETEGYNVAVSTSAAHAMSVLDALGEIDLILTDYRMPGVTGMDLLDFAIKRDIPIPVILFTGHGDVDTAVEVMKAGASDFICKPVSGKELLVRVKKVLEKNELAKEVTSLRKKLASSESFHTIVGKSKKMLDVYELINSIAKTDATVLIRGETGTGKELVAKAIHEASDRKDAPFVAVCCTALQQTLLESELFGHEKGAFTGAHASKPGKMETAGSGTFLLDEVGDTSLGIQSKLLRVLQEMEFERVGGLKTLKLNARVLASTHKNLEEDVRSEEFREDLYYRLNVLQIEVPPLREREGDILLLAEHFLAGFNKRYNKKTEGFAPSAITQMLEYNWPGNVRELKNVIERTVLTSPRLWIDKLSGVDLKKSEAGAPQESDIYSSMTDRLDYAHAKETALEGLEKTYLLHYLKLEKGKINKVADRMGVSVRTISRLMNKYDVDKVAFKEGV